MPVTFSEASTATFPQPAAGGRMTFIDGDGDGDLDILFQTGANGTAFQYARSNGDGTYTIVSLGNSPFAGLSLPDHNAANFHVGDIDGDGDMDLWAGQTTGAGVGSYFRNDGGSFSGQSSATFPAPGAASRVVMGDFDNDGDADMLYQTVGNGTAFQYAQSNGDGTYTLLTLANSPFAGLTIPDNGGGTHYAGDFDGDGDLDLWAAVGSATGSYFRNDGGSFTDQSTATFPAPAAATRVAVGDFDSDGDDDILYQTAGNGTAWQYARSNGDGTFTILSQAASPFAGVTLLDHNGSNALVGDVDGDGDDDLIITTNGTQGEFYLADGAPPVLSGSTPADNGTGMDVGADIVLAFNESVSKGAGNIYIYRGDGVLIETIAVGSAQVTGSGTDWTINPSVTLSGLTNYYVLADAGVFVDADGSIFFGIDDSTTLNFTTAASNTAPTFTNLDGDTPAFVEGAPVRLDEGGNATVADAEQANFNGGTLTVSITANEVPGQDVLSIANIGVGAGQISVSGSNISYQGVQIATFTGGTGGADLTITLDGDATPAATQALIRALQYDNTSQTPDTSSRTITLSLTDGAGGTSATQTVTVDVTAANDPHTGGASITGTAAEDQVLTAISTIADADGLGTLHYQWQRDTGSGFVDVGADQAIYTLGDDDVGGVVRVVISYTDGGGSAESATSAGTAVVSNVDDPAVAADDTGTTTEGSAVSGSVFGNDSDPDGPALTVGAVNGSAANVGTPITLASGALLTVNADGSYDYDPNGAFDHLGAAGSGGVVTSDTDSFTYTLAGGGTATVTITINGEDGDGDVVTGDSGDNVLDGGDGDDIVSGGGGADTLAGGNGVDTVDYANAGAGVVVRLNIGVTPNDGDGGSDILSGFENANGSAFNDTLVGSALGNQLSGGAGQDYLIGLGGDDILSGGPGAPNQLQGGLGDDLYFVQGNDTIVEFADEGQDAVLTDRARFVLAANIEELIYLGGGAFTGIGNAQDNGIHGGAGDDILSGRGGADELDGGVGTDTADYSLAASWVVASLADGGASDDGDGSSDTFTSIENLIGSAWADELTGDSGDNVLDGGDGFDVLIGGGGTDVLRGGLGYDMADYSGAAGGIFVKLNIGLATNDGDGASDRLIGIEDITGSEFDDVIIGDTLDNYLYGGSGRDVLIGGAGDDLLEGGNGAPNQLQGGLGDDRYFVEANDTLVEFADEGYDSVATTLNRYTLRANFEELGFAGVGDFVGIGNAGDNVIVGGDGNDTLTGGLGDDVLVGSSGCGCGGGGNDTVVLAGVFADYLIEDLGGGAWGVTDSVAGRDGVDLLLDIDQLRFSDGSTFALVSADPAPLLVGKDSDGPQVLPGLPDDDFILTKDTDLPLVLPGNGLDLTGDALQAMHNGVGPDAGPPGHMLSLDLDGFLILGADAFGQVHDGWLL